MQRMPSSPRSEAGTFSAFKIKIAGMGESPAGEYSHTPQHHDENDYLKTKALHLLGYLIDLKAQSTGTQRKMIIEDIQTLRDNPTEGTVQKLEMKWHRH